MIVAILNVTSITADKTVVFNVVVSTRHVNIPIVLAQDHVILDLKEMTVKHHVMMVNLVKTV